MREEKYGVRGAVFGEETLTAAVMTAHQERVEGAKKGAITPAKKFRNMIGENKM